MKIPKDFWRDPQAHKTSHGRLSVVAGSVGLAGAGLLAAQGAVRGGCGYVRWFVPEALYSSVAGLFADGLTTPLQDGGSGHFAASQAQSILEHQADALVAGPGWGQCAQRRGLLEALIQWDQAPLLLDADALNLLGSLEELKVRSSPTILTPHPGEAARLLGCSTDQVLADPVQAIQLLQSRSGAMVVLKGTQTLVVNNQTVWKNEQGGSATLATAGTGDVLTGLLGALLARCSDVFEAICFGVWWHAQAGIFLEKHYGPQGMGASALLPALLEVQKEFKK